MKKKVISEINRKLKGIQTKKKRKGGNSLREITGKKKENT